MCECCGGDCKLTTGDGWIRKLGDLKQEMFDVLKARGVNPLADIQNAVIDRLKDIGCAQERLKIVLEDDVFGKSAFDPYWIDDNPHFDERLDQIRLKIACLEDNLWDVWAILSRKDDKC